MTTQQSTFGSEFRIVPGWAKMLAVICGISVVLLLSVAFGREADPPHAIGQAFLKVFAAFVTAALVLLVGYVNRDAGRRGMSRTVWTLLVIFVPNALGFILYFLLRKPLLLACPNCGATVQPDFNYCPKCDHKLAPTCPSCGRPVRPGDIFCANCGTNLRPGEATVRV